MKFTRPMIDLAKAIRQRADSKDKPFVKMSDPDLPSTLNRIYMSSDDVVIKALIKEFFEMSLPVLDSPAQESDFTKRKYRGQGEAVGQEAEHNHEKHSHEKTSNNEKENKAPSRKKRIYRGQVVYDD